MKTFRFEELSQEHTPVQPGGCFPGRGGEFAVEVLMCSGITIQGPGFKATGICRWVTILQGSGQPFGNRNRRRLAAVDEDFARGDPGPGKDFELQFLGKVAKIEVFTVCQCGVSFLEDPGG